MSDEDLPTAALLVETDNDGFHLFHNVGEADKYYRKKKRIARDRDRPDGWVPDELNRDELVRRKDVAELIQKRLKKQEKRVDELDAFNNVDLNDAKARRQELKEILEIVEGED